MTIIDVLRQHVDDDPAKLYCRFLSQDRSFDLSYGQLWARAGGCAASLREAGVKPGEVVVIMLRHRVELYSTFLGAMMHGAIPSFMPCPNVKQRADVFWPSHRKLFARTQPGGFIAESDLLAPLSEVVESGVPMLDVNGLAAVGEAVLCKSGVDHVAFLQHSSGTTGTKKGVMLSHRAVIEQVRSYALAIGFDRNSHIASWLPLYHDMGLIACLFTPLVCGASVTHADALEWTSQPLSLLDMIERDGATHAWVPNFAFNHIAMNRRRAKGRVWTLDRLKMVINCSEPCKAESMEAFVAAFVDCGVAPTVPQVCYAMAENVFAVSQTDPGRPVRCLEASREALQQNRFELAEGGPAKRIPSCGRVLPGVEVAILGEGGQGLNDGAVGEIAIRGKCLFDGYYRLPETTAEKLRDGWYHSGDLGFIHDGELYVTGRVDDLIIVRGRNFYAHDIEAIVSAVPGVKPGRVVVFSVDNAVTGTQDVVCLAESDAPAEELAGLRRDVKVQVEVLSGLVLAKFQLYPVGTLVKTTSGKISREMNMKLFFDSQLGAEIFCA